MPHYFFNIRSDGELVKDEEGLTLPNLKEAREEAILSARDMVAECVRSGAPIAFGNAVEVKDAADTVVLTVSFAEAVPVAGNDNKKPAKRR